MLYLQDLSIDISYFVLYGYWTNPLSFYFEFFGDLFFIKEKKRQDKSQQINNGTWKQKVTHPHRGSQRGMDGFAMEIAIGE